MSVTRRDFLCSSTVIGTAVLLSPIVETSQLTERAFGAIPRQRTVNILRTGPAHVEFEAGVRAYLNADDSGTAPSVVDFLETAFADFDQLKGHLAQMEGTAVVGLMNDSESIFFNEAIRDIGGSVLCHGSHLVAGASSRHEFVTTPASAGIGAVFGQGLALGPHSATIQEITLHAPASPWFEPRIEASPGDWSWARQLGYRLGQVASGSWTTAPVRPQVVIGRAAHVPFSGTSVVSLVALI